VWNKYLRKMSKERKIIGYCNDCLTKNNPVFESDIIKDESVSNTIKRITGKYNNSYKNYNPKSLNKKWLNTSELAEHLGVPVATIHSRIRSGKIKSKKVKGRLKFNKLEL
jgi:hypothetical protein